MESEVLTHTVKDNHFVVDGVTDSRQHRADEGLIHFEREGNPAPADGVHSQNQQRVEDECHGGTDGERHVAEADENVDEDGSEGKEHTGDGAFCHVGSHCRSNLLGRNDGTSGVVVTVNEGGVVSFDELGIVESVKDEAFHFLVDVLAVVIDAIVGRETNCLIVCCGDGNCADQGVRVFRIDFLSHGFANLFGRHAFLFKFDDIVATAGEVNTFGETSDAQKAHTNHSSHDEHDGRNASLTHEVHRGVAQEVAAKFGGESQTEPLVTIVEVFVCNAGEPYCGKEGGADADAERHGEATDGSCSEVVEDDGSDDGRQVGVEDGAVGITIAILESLYDVLSGAEFFLGAFIDKHVGIHCHTERKHHTGNTAHGQGSLEADEHAEGEEEVEQECAVGNHARSEAVEEAHENHEEHECHDAGSEAGFDGGGTEARTNSFFLNDFGRGGHLTALQHVCQVAGVVCGEVTGDLRVSAGDFRLNDGSAIDISVQNDGNAFLQVLLGQSSPIARAVGGHGHADDGLMILVKVIFCVGNDVAFHGGTTVHFAECIEFEDISLHAFCRLHAPSELEVCGQCGLGSFALQESIDGSGVSSKCISHYASVGRHALDLHQFAQQRVLCGSVLSSFRCFGFSGIHSCAVSNVTLCKAGVKCLKSRIDFVERIGFPELEVSTSLKEFADTLGFFDSRHFHHDLTGLSLSAEDLDVRLSDAKSVNTRAHHLVGVFNCGVDLFVQCFLHLRVGGVVRDVLFFEF